MQCDHEALRVNPRMTIRQIRSFGQLPSSGPSPRTLLAISRKRMRRWGRRPGKFAHASVWPPRSERLGEAASSSLIVEGRNVIVTEVVERAVAERPGHDTIERIIEWLTADARHIGSFPPTLHQFSRPLLAPPLPPPPAH